MKAEARSEEDDPFIGRKLDKYVVVGLLGRGGMGRVYEARNDAIGKRVALKTLHPEVAKNREAAARFQREAQAASAVESPHIVEIFDAGFAVDGTPFIVMELMRGESLSAHIKRIGPLPFDETTRIVRQLLRGLAKAHDAGIVHRDLKPDNVFLVDREGDPSFVKILDFGISKVQRELDTPTTTLTREGAILGTPCYMSPEQAQGFADVDHLTDLWSVGAIVHECLTGRPPFAGTTYGQIVVQICTQDPPSLRALRPDVPKTLTDVVTRALTRERQDRVQTARDLLAILGGEAEARSTSPSAASLSSATATPRPVTGGGVAVDAAFDETIDVASAPTEANTPAGSTDGVNRATADTARSAAPPPMRPARGLRTFAMLASVVFCVAGLVALARYDRTSQTPETTPAAAAARRVFSPHPKTTAAAAGEATGAPSDATVRPLGNAADREQTAPPASASADLAANADEIANDQAIPGNPPTSAPRANPPQAPPASPPPASPRTPKPAAPTPPPADPAPPPPPTEAPTTDKGSSGKPGSGVASDLKLQDP